MPLTWHLDETQQTLYGTNMSDSACAQYLCNKPLMWYKQYLTDKSPHTHFCNCNKNVHCPQAPQRSKYINNLSTRTRLQTYLEVKHTPPEISFGSIKNLRIKTLSRHQQAQPGYTPRCTQWHLVIAKKCLVSPACFVAVPDSTRAHSSARIQLMGGRGRRRGFG